jgi:hypothetical protein
MQIWRKGRIKKKPEARSGFDVGGREHKMDERRNLLIKRRGKKPTVPQCIPSALAQRVSRKILTLSNGFACIGDMILE